MKYSATTGCFYPEWGQYTLPADAITVPEEDFAAAMNREAGEALAISDGRVVVVPVSAEATLAKAKAAKASEIDAAFIAAEATPVAVNGWLFKGGFTSGLAIDAQRRLAEMYRQLNPMAPETTTFFDIHGQPVTVPLLSETEIDAADICLTIGFLVGPNTFKYEQIRNAVWAATTVEEVSAISWGD